MAGIFDNIDPKTLGLLGAASGLLQAGGYSTKPVSFGQALGQGLQSGLGMYGQGLQFEELARKRKMAEEQQKRITDFASTLPSDAERQKFMIDPGAYLKTLQPYTLPAGGVRMGPDNKPLAQAPTRPPEPSAVSKLMAERDALPEGHPNRPVLDEAIKKATTSQPLVQVDTRQENEFSKKVGGEMGEQYSSLLKADMTAPTNIAKYQRLGQLLGSVNTGKFKGATTDIKAAAKSLGIDLNALGVADDVAPAQAARALSNQIALELRNPAGGAGMPGALSDKDREFLVQSIPGLENDPAAIDKMIEYRVKLEQRAQAVARKAREYRRKKGRFDEGFYDELQEWSDKNPLFPEVKAQTGQAPTVGPQKGQVVDGYEFIGGDPSKQINWRKK